MVNVQLSDGRILTERDPELAKPARIEPNAVYLATGERLYMMSRRPELPADTTVQPPSPVYVSRPIWRSADWVEAPYYTRLRFRRCLLILPRLQLKRSKRSDG